jgi:pimeloyl-ACP methyl ester carboxylesterase
MDDLRAVMDDAGSKRAAVFGNSEGGALSVLFTATYPERVSALVLYGAYPRMAWAPDYSGAYPRTFWLMVYGKWRRAGAAGMGKGSSSTPSRRTGPTIPPGRKHTGDGSAYRQVQEQLSRSSG